MKFTIPVLIKLSEEQKKELIKKVNLFYLGDENCNHMVNGKMVAKYPDKETQELTNAHFAAHGSYFIELSIDFDEKTGRPKKGVLKKINAT